MVLDGGIWGTIEGSWGGSNGPKPTDPQTNPLNLTGPKPKEIKVETFRIDYLRRTPKVEKLSLQPISS